MLWKTFSWNLKKGVIIGCPYFLNFKSKHLVGMLNISLKAKRVVAKLFANYTSKSNKIK